jgi:hypothetical protein
LVVTAATADVLVDVLGDTVGVTMGVFVLSMGTVAMVDVHGMAP